MHSYSSISDGDAVEGLSKIERTQVGKEGGILGLLHVGASIIQVRHSLGSFAMANFGPENTNG